jgi:hypothetical protein
MLPHVCRPVSSFLLSAPYGVGSPTVTCPWTHGRISYVRPLAGWAPVPARVLGSTMDFLLSASLHGGLLCHHVSLNLCPTSFSPPCRLSSHTIICSRTRGRLSSLHPFAGWAPVPPRRAPNAGIFFYRTSREGDRLVGSEEMKLSNLNVQKGVTY